MNGRSWRGRVGSGEDSNNFVNNLLNGIFIPMILVVSSEAWIIEMRTGRQGSVIDVRNLI